MIESITATVPCAGLQYTDLRPTITANSIEEYREQLIEVGKLAGNEAFVKRMSTQLDEQTGLTGALSAPQSILGDGVLFNKEEHTYSKNGLPYLSGSTFAHMFEKEFPKEAVAAKLAEKEGREVDEVLEGWDAKGQISLDYGTLIHKCIETFIKHGATPTNQYLADIVCDWEESCYEPGMKSEVFLQDDEHQMCGVIDLLGEHEISDIKTGDIHQKIQHKLGKEFPNDRLSLYTLQLNFYRYLAEQNGKKINKLTIHWLNGDHFEKVRVDIIDIKPYLEQVWKPKKLSSN